MARIRNTITGEVLDIPEEQLQQYGIAPQPTPTPTVTPPAETTPLWKSAIRTGLPIAGGIAGGIIGGLSTLPTVAGVPAGVVGGTGLGVYGGRTLAGLATGERPEKIVPSGMKEAGVGMAFQALLPFLRYKGLAKTTERAAGEATKKGIVSQWSGTGGLREKVEQRVIKEFGDTAQIRKALNSLLGKRAPAAIEEIIEKTPETLLTERRQLLRTYGPKIIEKYTGAPLEKEIAGVVRSELSAELHRIVPETATPDKIYAFYKTIHGDVPAWIRNIIVGSLAAKIAGKLFWPIRYVAGGLGE